MVNSDLERKFEGDIYDGNLNITVSSVGFLSFKKDKKSFSLTDLLKNNQFVRDGKQMVEVCCSHKNYREGNGLKFSIYDYMGKKYKLNEDQIVDVYNYFVNLKISQKLPIAV